MTPERAAEIVLQGRELHPCKECKGMGGSPAMVTMQVHDEVTVDYGQGCGACDNTGLTGEAIEAYLMLEVRPRSSAYQLSLRQLTRDIDVTSFRFGRSHSGRSLR